VKAIGDTGKGFQSKLLLIATAENESLACLKNTHSTMQGISHAGRRI